MDGLRIEPLEPLESDLSRAFREVFRPMSPNPAAFELMCYLRWFYLLELMRRDGIEEVFYFDSDVLIYTSCSEIRDQVTGAGKEAGYTIAKQREDSRNWVAGGHSSYWTRGMLEEFCKFCVTTYTDETYLSRYEKKRSWHAETGMVGGISDMTTLYLFWSENRDRIFNLGTCSDDAVMDLNIIDVTNDGEDRYVMQNGIKKVMFNEGVPQVHLLPDAAPVKAITLHFQGGRKKLIPDYYTGPGFRGKTRIKIGMKLKAIRKKLPPWLR